MDVLDGHLNMWEKIYKERANAHIIGAWKIFNFQVIKTKLQMTFNWKEKL